MRIIVALKLAICGNAKMLINGDRYVNCMTGNAHFQSLKSVELVAKCKICVTNLRTAINAPKSETKTDNIRIARDALDRSLTMLGANVEHVANDPSILDSQRVEIVHSTGMEIKSQVHRGRFVFSVKNTDVSGTVRLRAQGRKRAHEWQYTDDVINFTGRIAVPSTTKATTHIANLKKVTEYAFFHKAIKRGGNTDWEGPILLVVI